MTHSISDAILDISDSGYNLIPIYHDVYLSLSLQSFLYILIYIAQDKSTDVMARENCLFLREMDQFDIFMCITAASTVSSTRRSFFKHQNECQFGESITLKSFKTCYYKWHPFFVTLVYALLLESYVILGWERRWELTQDTRYWTPAFPPWKSKLLPLTSRCGKL